MSVILSVAAAIAIGLAVIQITRHGLEAGDTIDASAAVKGLDRSACISAQPHFESPRAASTTPAASSVALRLDYAGAEALINALERGSLSDADVDSLLRIKGLCAMVGNIPRYFPAVPASAFRSEIQGFARTKKGGQYDDFFRLSRVWHERSRVRSLISQIRTSERVIVQETVSRLERYRPDTATLAVTTYFVAGGVSDGFAFENDPGSLYANLATAEGDLNGVVLNVTHEAYHVMQFRAQARAGMDPLSLASDTTAPVERLFATTLSEGTASFVADPTRSTAFGPKMERARERYRHNAEPGRIAENFARFDAVLMKLSAKRMTWGKAYTEGFTSTNDASLYFVGYEMTKALEQYCGRECIGRLFAERPVAFFRRYIALYHQHPELTGRFSRETEAFIAAYGTNPAR